MSDAHFFLFAAIMLAPTAVYGNAHASTAMAFMLWIGWP